MTKVKELKIYLLKLLRILSKISLILDKLRTYPVHDQYLRGIPYDIRRDLYSLVEEFIKEGELIYRLSTQEVIPNLDKTYYFYELGTFEQERLIAFHTKYFVLCLSLILSIALSLFREVVTKTSPTFSFKVVRKLKEMLSHIYYYINLYCYEYQRLKSKESDYV
ncbi:MAG: hypothetical protein QXX03_05735 [Nitrososphaerota archaeon]